MGTGAKNLVGVLVTMFVVVLASLGWVVSINNTCVQQEAGLEAQYKQNQNNYDNFYKSVVETLGISKQYAEELRKTYDKAIKSRYGEEGSKALFQMITEQNPQMDASLFKKVQELVESGRANFAADQKTLLDKKQVYETYMGQIPNGPVAKFLGFPKKDIAKFDIVTSERTEKAFETKKDEAIQTAPQQ